MRLVVDDHNANDMKCLSDFDRILNLLGELNSDFPYNGIIQLKKNSCNREVELTVDSNVSLHGDRLGFEVKVISLWNMCFDSSRSTTGPPVKFYYSCGYSQIRQEGSGC